MQDHTPKPVLLILVALVAFLSLAPAFAQEEFARTFDVRLTGEEVRERLLDILDDSELTVRTVEELDQSFVSAIQTARGQVVNIPRARLESFGEDAGGFLDMLSRSVKRQRRLTQDIVRLNKKGIVPKYLQSIPGFPELRNFGKGPGIADYPNADLEPQSDTGTSEDEFESQEDSEENREDAWCVEAEVEDDREPATFDCDFNGDLCTGDCPGNQNTRGGDGVTGPGAICRPGPATTPADPDAFRATREGAGTILQNTLLINITRTLAAISGRFCDQDIAGFSCSLCCIPIDILVGIQEALFDIMKTCASLTDGAEIEMAYWNTVSTYRAVDHLHGDLETHDTAIKGDLAAHDTAINSRLSTHDTDIKTQLSTHDTDIETQLSTHDSDIMTQLSTHDIDIKALLGGVQDTLDNEIELRRVHIDVAEVSPKKDYLVSTTEAGQPVDVEFLSVAVSRLNNVSFVETLGSSKITQLMTGVYLVELSTSPSINQLVRVKVRHDDVVDHFGEMVFYRGGSSSQ